MSKIACSFCGRSANDVDRVISSPLNNESYICNECVLTCVGILEDDREGSTVKAPRKSWLKRLF